MDDIMLHKKAVMELAKVNQKFGEMVFAKRITGLVTTTFSIDPDGYEMSNRSFHAIWSTNVFNPKDPSVFSDSPYFNFSGFHPDGAVMVTNEFAFGFDSADPYIIQSGNTEVTPEAPSFLITTNHEGSLIFTLVEPILSKSLSPNELPLGTQENGSDKLSLF